MILLHVGNRNFVLRTIEALSPKQWNGQERSETQIPFYLKPVYIEARSKNKQYQRYLCCTFSFKRLKCLEIEIFIVRNAVRKEKSCCLAVICRKRSAFDMQFSLIIVLIYLKTCVKDRGDSSARLLERGIWLVCIKALLLAVLSTFRSTLPN